eukprot:tig00021608_g22849.t1
MAGFAQANERTLRAFLAALQQRILAQDGALSPLQLDEIFVAACKTHGCRTVLPPRPRPHSRRRRLRSPRRARRGSPAPDEERLGYPSTTTSHAPVHARGDAALDRCHFTWNCVWGTAPFPNIPYSEWVKGIADKRARRRDRPAREEDAADERSEPGPTRGGFSHRGGHRQEPYARGGYRNDRGGFGRTAAAATAGAAPPAPCLRPEPAPAGKGKEKSAQDDREPGCWTCGSLDHIRRDCRTLSHRAAADAAGATARHEPRAAAPVQPSDAAAAALHESARGASSSSAGGNPNAGAPPGGPSIRSLSVHVMPVGTDSDSDEAAAVAAVRQPSDALAMAAKARDQAAFDAAAADISAGALDDATREAAFERDLRCANPASEDGSGESELGESDAERLDTDSESAPSSDPGQGSAPYASDTSKPAYFGPFGSPDRDVPQAPPRCSTKSWALDYMPYDHVPATDVEKEGEREGGPYLPRYVSPTLLVRELAQEGPKGIVLDRFLGACGLRRPERLLLGRLAHRTEAHSLACVIEAAATIAKLDYRLQEGPDSSIAMLAIRGAQLSHPVTKCSGIGSAPDPEDLWPDDPNELDVA